ncbi:monocarboxylate transporter 2-like [Mya arenaria]|uniref:monocarboxylate transporter 2-like n=1 Tax=Mya arenaria TaxID=6604 RepID=UPI0022DEAB5A|nr:monocarboxylate transporter 2-like [Mya arenaria]
MENLERFRDLDSPWSWVVLVASFVSLFVVGGTNYSVGLVHNVLLDRYNGTQSSTALVGAVYTSISNVAAPLSSFLTDRFGVRPTIMLSGLLYTSGYLGAAFAPTLATAAVTCGVIAGFGCAICWTSSMVACNFHFRKYRNLALGLAISGSGAGVFGVPPIITWAKGFYGSFGFFVTLACITAQLIVCGFVIRPSHLEIYAKRKRSLESKKGEHVNLLRLYFNVLKSKVVMCMSLSMLTYCAGMYIVFLYLPRYCTIQGSTEFQASNIVSICGLTSLLGRILTGAIANTKFFQPRVSYLYAGSLVLLSAISCAFPLYSSRYPGQVAFAVVFGLCFGTPYTVINAVNLQHMGVEIVTAALGVEFCFCGLGGLLGPVVAGLSGDAGATLGQVFLIAGIFIGVSSVFGFIPNFISTRVDGGADLTTSDIELEVDADSRHNTNKQHEEQQENDQKDTHSEKINMLENAT